MPIPMPAFVNDTVELPPGFEPTPLIMDPGDVLFFNGQLVHGSYPNSAAADRFRCAMIGHYIVGEAEAVCRCGIIRCFAWMAAN